MAYFSADLVIVGAKVNQSLRTLAPQLFPSTVPSSRSNARGILIVPDKDITIKINLVANANIAIPGESYGATFEDDEGDISDIFITTTATTNISVTTKMGPPA